MTAAVAEILKQKVESIEQSSFKNRRRRHFKKRGVAIDAFGNTYQAQAPEDLTQVVCITLPKSLVKLVDENRGEIPRSRYVREMVEYCLEVEQILATEPVIAVTAPGAVGLPD